MQKKQLVAVKQDVYIKNVDYTTTNHKRLHDINSDF